MTLRYLRCVLFKKIYYLYLFIAFVLFYIYLRKDSVVDILDRQSILLQIDETIKKHANTGACKQPNLPIYSAEMMKFVKHVPPIDCSQAGPDWVTCEGSECRISPDIIIQKGPIKCSFTDIIRKDDFNFVDGETTTSDSYYKLESSDTVRVHCVSLEEKWDSILTGIRVDKAIWSRSGWEHVPEDGMKLNVLMFGFDSMSRNSVIRKLPETHKYLKTKMNAHILEGYNIIGDGTPQALTPMLTGKTELELPETRKRVKDANYVNVYPFIWDDFKKNGYVTGYLEDCPTIGTYTYRLKGFNEMPTDHYMRTYYMSTLKMIPKWPNLCAGSIPRHKVMMNHAKDFFHVYKNKPKFLFGFHGEISHDNYNTIGVADEDVLEFVRDMHTSGALNDTIFIFMADHGHRFADIRNTVQGKMEERLPYFSFAFPTWFKQKYSDAYDNFVNNVQTLVTPFDIYSTLQSVLHLTDTGVADLSKRSVSLFTNIPKERSCAQAYIEPHWCACLEWNSISLSSPIIQRLGDEFVKILNDYTESQRTKCAILRISAIYWVSQLTPNENLLKYKKNHDYDGFVPDLTGKTDVSVNIYQMKVMLSPGDSLFEVTISHHLNEDQMEIKMSDISRINLYGRQARCIENSLHHLRKYCYCITD
ncbi:PREDICTED: uncharacterized protein LOC108556871 [Nicrophorus vespilloides]|uniref:Uncharacterized protein LOC108556871 n=1 Tax=Nicrophorus vespilloides TaxID=110193 RepID=A0ABM1M242_NICVS|nr:PREDICTED: uncharacterized protein LOC108556871 [Nicrophorus vespilloides]